MENSKSGYFNPMGAHPNGIIGEEITDKLSNIFQFW